MLLAAPDLFETVCDVANTNKIAIRPWQEARTFRLKHGQKPNAPPYQFERMAYAPLEAFAIIGVEPTLGQPLVWAQHAELLSHGGKVDIG